MSLNGVINTVTLFNFSFSIHFVVWSVWFCGSFPFFTLSVQFPLFLLQSSSSFLVRVRITVLRRFKTMGNFFLANCWINFVRFPVWLKCQRHVNQFWFLSFLLGIRLRYGFPSRSIEGYWVYDWRRRRRRWGRRCTCCCCGSACCCCWSCS